MCVFSATVVYSACVSYVCACSRMLHKIVAYVSAPGLLTVIPPICAFPLHLCVCPWRVRKILDCCRRNGKKQKNTTNWCFIKAVSISLILPRTADGDLKNSPRHLTPEWVGLSGTSQSIDVLDPWGPLCTMRMTLSFGPRGMDSDWKTASRSAFSSSA